MKFVLIATLLLIFLSASVLTAEEEPVDDLDLNDEENADIADRGVEDETNADETDNKQDDTETDEQKRRKPYYRPCRKSKPYYTTGYRGMTYQRKVANYRCLQNNAVCSPPYRGRCRTRYVSFFTYGYCRSCKSCGLVYFRAKRRTCQCVRGCPFSHPPCRMYCKYGYQYVNGCPICKCKCGPLCKIYCKYGNVLDKNGCPICKCKPKPQCPPVCEMHCQYGMKLDKNGCKMCSCCPPPTLCKCPCGTVHVPRKDGCKPTCSCRPCNKGR